MKIARLLMDILQREELTRQNHSDQIEALEQQLIVEILQAIRRHLAAESVPTPPQVTP